MKRLLIIIPLTLVLFSLFSCDAPRLNPLDPQSSEYNIGEISGRVYSFPHDALGGVTITWKNQNISTTTDLQGQYKLEDVKMADGMVYFEKLGFSKDSAFVTWNNQRSIQLEEKVLKFTMGRLDGYIRTEALPRPGIQGAKVFWKNQNILIETDANGYFSFNNIPYEDGDLYIEKDGYTKDTVHVTFNDSKSKTIEDQFLNAIPVLNKFLLYTTVVYKLPNDIQSIKLEIKALVTDKDGQSDIDTVFVTCPALDNFSKVLLYGGQDNGYQGTFVASDLKLLSLDEAIGKEFHIIIKDKRKKVYDIGSSNIKRIIKDPPSILFPANRVTTTTSPTLNWNRYLPGFNFTYTIQIITDDLERTVEWQSTGISKDDIETAVSTLAQGDYYWIIICVDDFGDSVSSTPGSFTVQ